MARLDTITKLPPWQMVFMFLLVSAGLGAAWYFLYFADAVAERESADAALTKAKTELEAMETKRANFEQEMKQAADAEREIEAAKSVLPLSEATVDHLMRTFQQQARLVGLEIGKWSPGAERQLDFYAKMPVKIEAVGTWHQAGEFFRRVSELSQIVSVEEVQLKAGKAGEGPHPRLELEFLASTFRFLPEGERGAGDGQKREAKP